MSFKIVTVVSISEVLVEYHFLFMLWAFDSQLFSCTVNKTKVDDAQSSLL